jgi:hypothetical protein
MAGRVPATHVFRSYAALKTWMPAVGGLKRRRSSNGYARA